MSERQSQERGAVAVEFGLVMPLLLLVILGGTNLGLALATRHQLGDAASVATRTAAVSGTTDAATVRTLIVGRMGTGAARCANLAVGATVVPSIAGTSRLEVTATCTLVPPFGAALLGTLGPDQLTVNAAMPL